MEEVDIVLTPPARGAAPVYEAPSTPSFATWAHAGFNMQANVLGLPALTFMAGQDGGLPVAAQLWASCGNDHIVLAAGRAVEKVLNDKGMRPTEWPAF
jgi:Asp-tRNA(Asn)/Glu-tRNA(Gln) amidotransferase A subunit family amidase